MSKREEMMRLKKARRADIKDIAERSPESSADKDSILPDAEAATPSVDTPQKAEISPRVTEPDVPGDGSDFSSSGESDDSSAELTLDHTFRIRDLNTETTPTTVRLFERNARFLSIRSSQLGMAYQDYFNLLIEEEKGRITGGKTVDPYSISAPTVEKTVVKSVVLTRENFDFVKKQAAACGLRTKMYLNLLCDEERGREESQGSRKGLYD